MPISGLSAPSSSVGSAMPMLVLSAPSASTKPVPSLSIPSISAGFTVLMPGFYAPSTSAKSGVSVPGLSTPSAFIEFAVPVSSLSAPSACALFAFSGFALPVLGSSASTTSIFGSFAFFASVMTLTSEKQKLIELNQREKRATLKKLVLTFTFLLLSESFLLFPVSCIIEKWSFNKTFDINSCLLTKDQFDEEVDLSFAVCQYLSTVKANRIWQ